ncbi:hypothetical protein KH172YL63_06320 [Bacillus sp. KH172YL63]|nr:hypothetical protein KH172YL63_06320 [Bacillus sp. KH172YL63]
MSAKVEGKPISEVFFVYAGCQRCDHPKLTLCVPDCIDCEGAKITGEFSCNGRPVGNAKIELKVSPKVATINPEKVITNEHGEYEAWIHPDGDVNEDVLIQATARLEKKEIVSVNKMTKIHCICKHPVVELDSVTEIICCGRIGGTVLCDGIPVPDIDIELDSPLLEFEKKMVTTNEQGRFSSEVTVPEDTDFQEIPYTATAIVSGEVISAKGFVYGGCLLCEDPDISLRVPLCIDCKGATITGKVMCDDIPLEGVKVFFEVMEKDLKKIIQPNPAVTNASGKYSARITSVHGMDHCLTLRAGILWGGRKIYTKPFYTIIECTC